MYDTTAIRTVGSALQAAAPDSTVALPGTAQYDESIRRWAPNAEKRSAVILRAISGADVSTGVLFAQAMGLEVAVVGGGHGTNGAAATPGLLIDLRALNKITVDVEHKTITAGGGCRWEDIDLALAPHGLVTVGGRVGDTGIGGLTLGGGVGWLSGKYGLVVDNLLRAQMVLADERIVTASATENPDLFWAVRGAGQCFGVAIELTYRAHNQADPIWPGQLVTTLDTLPAVVDFANRFPAINRVTNAASLNVTIAGPPVNSLVTTLLYPGQRVEAEAFFAPLLALDHVHNTTAERPYTEANTIITPRVPWDIRRQNVGIAFPVPLRVGLLESLINSLVELRGQVSADAPPGMVILEMTEKGTMGGIPTSAMAFAGRQLHNVCMVVAQWRVAEHDLVARQWLSKAAATLDHELEAMKDKHDGSIDLNAVRVYSNYDSLLMPEEEVFGTNLPRLTMLKEKYDPKDVFCTSYALLRRRSIGGTTVDSIGS
ncbi:hypothetical protein BJX99DRAFT_262126 [Aspergillus californicus]